MHGGIPDTRNGGCMLAIAAGLRQHETDTLEKERAQATKRLKRGELAEKNKRVSLIDALEKFTSEDFNAEKLSLARLAVIIRWRGGEAKNLKKDDREEAFREALAEWARVAPRKDTRILALRSLGYHMTLAHHQRKPAAARRRPCLISPVE